MSDRVRNVNGSTGSQSQKLGQDSAGGPWPSKTNPSAAQRAAESARNGPAIERRTWWHRKNELVDEWLEEAPNRAARPVSVIGATKLREEASTERGDEDSRYRSRSWSAVLREFLTWYNGYRFCHLLMNDPDGNIVRLPMKNSHQPRYGDIYYAKLKALERQILKRFDNPHVVMLTLTASFRNSMDGYRCPADHLRDVVEPFSDHVRPALHRALGPNGADVDRWEYAKVLEHHETGYGHMHVAVFVDGEVSESDFHGAIDAHIRHCDPAHRSAHDYHDPDPENRPISVNKVRGDLDVDADQEELEGIGNLGSYIAEYIGSYGEELFDRSIEELAFRAACWATTTHRVDFSNGADEFIAAELGRDTDNTEKETIQLTWRSDVTGDEIDQVDLVIAGVGGEVFQRSLSILEAGD